MTLTSWNVPITVGTPAVTDVIPAAGFEVDAILTLAAAAERGSEHPFATAIVHGAADRGLTAIEPTSVATIPHHGIRARFGERRVLVGSRALLEAAGVKAAALANDAVRLVDEGKSPVFVALDDRAAGIIAIGACVGCLHRFHAHTDRFLECQGDSCCDDAAEESRTSEWRCD